MAKEIIIITDYAQDTLTLDEVCSVFHIDSDVIINLVEYEIIHPKGRLPKDWEFDLNQLKKIKTALRLQHDLEMNLQGVAIVMRLLEERKSLRLQLEILEKHFSKL